MFLWSVAIGLTGFLGGLLPLIVVGVALVCTPGPRRVIAYGRRR